MTETKDKIRYIVILQQIITTGDYKTQFSHSYGWDGEEFNRRARAAKHGFEIRGSDDFNIGELINDRLVRFYWMNELLQDYDLKEIAEQIGLENK